MLAYPVESVLISVALAVGVGALSALAALYGVSDEMARRLRVGLKSRQFVIAPATIESLTTLSGDNLIAPLRENLNTNLHFTEGDLDGLRELTPGVDHLYCATPYFFSLQTASLGEILPHVDIVAADYVEAAGIGIARGSWFSQADHDEGRRVLLVIESDARRFGLESDLLGQEVPMNLGNGGGAPYTIIGVQPADHAAPTVGGLSVSGYIPSFSQPAYRPNRLYAAVDDPRKIARGALDAVSKSETLEEPRLNRQPDMIEQTLRRFRGGPLVCSPLISLGA